jgi:hypothetical protein
MAPNVCTLEQGTIKEDAVSSSPPFGGSPPAGRFSARWLQKEML